MRIETITRELYKFEELSEKAKQNAIDVFRQHNIFEDEATLDDAKTIAKLMGITIDNIFYSGFSCQGDGACFDGVYSYTENSVKKLKEYAPVDLELHRIVEVLEDIQKHYGNCITATITHKGRYCNSSNTTICVNNDVKVIHNIDERHIIELLRDFMTWIYKQLEREYDYQNSDEHITEIINSNDYEFLKDGTLA